LRRRKDDGFAELYRRCLNEYKTMRDREEDDVQVQPD